MDVYIAAERALLRLGLVSVTLSNRGVLSRSRFELYVRRKGGRNGEEGTKQREDCKGLLYGKRKCGVLYERG